MSTMPSLPNSSLSPPVQVSFGVSAFPPGPVSGALTVQPPLGIAGVTNNPTLNAIFQTLNTSAQTGFTGLPLKIPGVPDNFTAQGTIFPPISGIPPVMPSPAGAPTASPVATATVPVATPPSPAPSGLPPTASPLVPVTGNNPLTSPTGNLFSTPTGLSPLTQPSLLGGVNPLLAGGNPLLGGLPAGGSATGTLGGMLQVLVQLLLTLRQQPGGLPGAPGTPTAPVDPEKEALKKRIDDLEKKLDTQDTKKTDPAPAKENKPKDNTPAQNTPPAKPESKDLKDINDLILAFGTRDKNGDGVLDPGDLINNPELSASLDYLMFAQVDSGKNVWFGLSKGDLQEIKSRLENGETLSSIRTDLRQTALDAAKKAGFSTVEAYVQNGRNNSPFT